MRALNPETAWERGRLDARRGASRLLFGRMHEDASIELAAFRPGSRVFCIASAGCTAIALSRRHEVVAVDVNPMQVEYARRRFAGEPASGGVVDRLLAFGRACAPVLGWRPSRLREFLELDDPADQMAFWRRHLDTRRLRLAMDLVLSRAVLATMYAGPLLRAVPPRFGVVMRGRMTRGFARHSNRRNPYARALLLGEWPEAPAPPDARHIRLVHAEAAAFLEREPAGGFDGFSLSNILDGASEAHAARLRAAVRHAAAPGAVAILRSFAEPRLLTTTNRAADDRSMLWGIVDVGPAEEF